MQRGCSFALETSLIIANICLKSHNNAPSGRAIEYSNKFQLGGIKVKRLKVAIGVALVLVLLLLAGCIGNQAKPPVTKVRYCETVHSIFYTPVYVALTQGFFRAQGLDIEMSTAQGTDKVMTALLSNAADISLGDPEPTVYAYKQGRDNYAITFAAVTKRDGSFLVGRKPEPDFRWENLKGRTVIGSRPGGMPEMVLEHILKQHGLQPGKDVTIITNLQFTAATGAFAGGTGDYLALLEPTASLVEKQGGGSIIASIGQASGEVPYTGLMASKSFIEQHPDVVQQMTNGLYMGQLWVINHSPAEIAKAIQQFFPESDLDLLTRVVARYKSQDTWKTTPILEYQDFAYMEEILAQSGMIDKPVDPIILVNQSFAREAVKTIK